VAMANPAGAAPRTMRLPDGSSVTLAPGSALEASRGYGTSHREVRLTGEGAFAVMPGARPFRVLLRGTVVEDVSTAFLVRPDGDGILVAVSEGAVIAGAGRDTLRQGMAAQVDSGGEVPGWWSANSRGPVAPWCSWTHRSGRSPPGCPAGAGVP